MAPGQSKIEPEIRASSMDRGRSQRPASTDIPNLDVHATLLAIVETEKEFNKRFDPFETPTTRRYCR